MTAEGAGGAADQPVEGEVERFWAEARRSARLENMPGYFGPDALSSVVPPTWSFSDQAGEADRLLGLLLDGTITATSSRRSEHGPEITSHVGDLGIVLDGAGDPCALVVTAEVREVPWTQVDEAQALAEGAASLGAWRTEHPAADHEPMVLERLEVLHPATHPRSALATALGLG